jgi:hypothetical protein
MNFNYIVQGRGPTTPMLCWFSPHGLPSLPDAAPAEERGRGSREQKRRNVARNSHVTVASCYLPAAGGLLLRAFDASAEQQPIIRATLPQIGSYARPVDLRRRVASGLPAMNSGSAKLEEIAVLSAPSYCTHVT